MPYACGATGGGLVSAARWRLGLLARSAGPAGDGCDARQGRWGGRDKERRDGLFCVCLVSACSMLCVFVCVCVCVQEKWYFLML